MPYNQGVQAGGVTSRGCANPPSFRAPSFVPGRRSPGDTGYTLVSEGSGRRWRVINSVRQCQFGQVLCAVELKRMPSGEWGHDTPKYFAIKVSMMKMISPPLSSRNRLARSVLCLHVRDAPAVCLMQCRSYGLLELLPVSPPHTPRSSRCCTRCSLVSLHVSIYSRISSSTLMSPAVCWRSRFRRQRTP